MLGPIEVFGFLASVASLVLAIIAIWLSLYFYKAAKGAELDAARSLEGIRAQTQVLQSLVGRQLDKLTSHLVKPVTHMPGETKPLISPTSNGEKSTEPSKENLLVSSVYYTCQANIMSQRLVTFPASMADQLEHFRVMDMSASDFGKILQSAEGIPDEKIEKSWRPFLEFAQKNKEHVRPAQAFIELSQATVSSKPET